MTTNDMGARPPAPLAQLRDVDPRAWDALTTADRHPNPGTDSVTQALAAALLGGADLALQILRDGSIHRWEWPDLRDQGTNDQTQGPTKRVEVIWQETTTYKHTFEVPADWSDGEIEDGEHATRAEELICEDADFIADVVSVDQRDIIDVRERPAPGMHDHSITEDCHPSCPRWEHENERALHRPGSGDPDYDEAAEQEHEARS